MRTFALTSLGMAVGLFALSGCDRPPTETPTRSAAVAPDPAKGKAVFARTCAVCHMNNGQGVPGTFPPLAGSAIVNDKDPAKIIRIVLHGLQGPLELDGQTYNSVMPAQGPSLKDDEIAGVISYVRSAWGNQAPAVSAEAVALVRRNTKRDQMWTWQELKQP